MSDETIVAVYDTAAHAEAAIRDLKAAGTPDNAISQHAGAVSSTTGTTAEPVKEQGFWASLFGGEPDHDTAVYDRSLQGGSTVVSVRTPDAHVTRVTEILEGHHPIDMDERAASYGMTQTTTTRAAMPATKPTGATTAAAASDEGSLKLAEERLAVGKRLVNRGGTRIRRFVTEVPVEQQVSLRSETVTMERHPVADARPATDADFTDKTIEMTESGEEAVVAKEAFIREEVSLRKQATERTETVRDTVRREDVEVEKVPAATAASTTTTTTTPAAPLPPRAKV